MLADMYGDEVVGLAHEYTEIRKTMVLPRLQGKVDDALKSGMPLVTPLVLYAPEDPVMAGISDQWILGHDLLVAPITHRGQRSRHIYLPEGIWRDELDGYLRRGGRWIKDYKVPLTKIPYFTREVIDGP